MLRTPAFTVKKREVQPGLEVVNTRFPTLTEQPAGFSQARLALVGVAALDGVDFCHFRGWPHVSAGRSSRVVSATTNAAPDKIMATTPITGNP